MGSIPMDGSLPLRVSGSHTEQPGSHSPTVSTLTQVHTHVCAHTLTRKHNSLTHHTSAHSQTCVHTCTHIRVHTQVHILSYACTHSQVHTHKHACTHECTFAQVHAHAHTSAHSQSAHTCTHIQVHTQVHVLTSAHSHKCTHAHVLHPCLPFSCLLHHCHENLGLVESQVVWWERTTRPPDSSPSTAEQGSTAMKAAKGSRR